MGKRSCYICINFGLCFIRRGMEKFLSPLVLNYLKIESKEEPPLYVSALYDTLGQCCKEFKVIENV